MEFERLEIPVGEFVFDARAAGPADGELVLLLHGFPQTSWEWRSQLQALGDAGYRAVAPDQRGYSPRARPQGVENYRADHLAADVLAIGARFPVLERIHLTDYKVRVLDTAKGTGAITRVLIDSTDGERSWSTIGVSDNIIEASWQALCDSIVYGLLHNEGNPAH